MRIRIPRATDSIPGYAPYQVQMVYSSTNQPNCGATIINAFFILTAAHCLVRRGSSKMYRHPSEIRIVAGKYKTSGYDETQQVRNILEIIAHPFYDKRYLLNDIALLRVSHPLKFNRYVQPIPMAMDFRQFTGQVSVYGFGITRTFPGDLSQFPETSRVSTLQIISTSECSRLHNPSLVTHHMMCAVSKKTALCPGDSGSPVVCQDDSIHISSLPLGRQPSRDILCGIVSWGGPLVECMAHWNGSFRSEPWAQVFTKVSHFSDWVSHAIQGRKIESHFLCKSNLQYVYKFEKCNSHVDCEDGSDEMDCEIQDEYEYEYETVTENFPKTTTPPTENIPSTTTPITESLPTTTTPTTENMPTTTTENLPTTMTTPITEADPTTTTPTAENYPTTTTEKVTRATPMYQIIDLDDFDLSFANWKV
ncbi:transmembrane protease serine 9-like [Folsomia candida]|uniref:transmembrane protease serine 9-like n=1 Tax=Folsomia candida TaxID=158441 RepID=UPI001604AF64|nr:transmembrane protease serine 9-like [Folsomia candida]